MMENKAQNATVETVEMKEEDTKAMFAQNADQILTGLLEAANYDNAEEEVHPVEIVRNGKTLFKFRIHPLSEEAFSRCRKKYTNYKRNKQIGIKFAEDTDTTRYRSQIIYEATVKEDREAVWDNRQAWKKLDCLTAVDLIDKVLKAGEKDAVIEKIEMISGYDSTVALEDTAKN